MVVMTVMVCLLGGQIWDSKPSVLCITSVWRNVFLNRLDNAHVFHKAVGDKDAGVTMPTPDYAVSRNVGAARCCPGRPDLPHPIPSQCADPGSRSKWSD
jgi:hypothetical protein